MSIPLTGSIFQCSIVIARGTQWSLHKVTGSGGESLMANWGNVRRWPTTLMPCSLMEKEKYDRCVLCFVSFARRVSEEEGEVKAVVDPRGLAGDKARDNTDWQTVCPITC